MNNSWWGKPENNGIKVIILIIIIAVAGYFIYQNQHKNALSNTGAAGTLANSAGVTGSCMGVTLHPVPDTSFTATNVNHGDLGDTVALFKLYNDAPCIYNLKTLRFNFMPTAVSASAMAAYSAPVLKNIIVKVNGVPFGVMVPAPVGPGHAMNFIATGTVVIPASSLGNTMEIIADIDPLAPISDSFKIRMTGMTALNTTTTATYNWLPAGLPVMTSLFTIL